MSPPSPDSVSKVQLGQVGSDGTIPFNVARDGTVTLKFPKADDRAMMISQSGFVQLHRMQPTYAVVVVWSACMRAQCFLSSDGKPAIHLKILSALQYVAAYTVDPLGHKVCNVATNLQQHDSD